MRALWVWEDLHENKLPACSRAAGHYVGRTTVVLDVKDVVSKLRFSGTFEVNCRIDFVVTSSNIFGPHNFLILMTGNLLFEKCGWSEISKCQDVGCVCRVF